MCNMRWFFPMLIWWGTLAASLLSVYQHDGWMSESYRAFDIGWFLGSLIPTAAWTYQMIHCRRRKPYV